MSKQTHPVRLERTWQQTQLAQVWIVQHGDAWWSAGAGPHAELSRWPSAWTCKASEGRLKKSGLVTQPGLTLCLLCCKHSNASGSEERMQRCQLVVRLPLMLSTGKQEGLNRTALTM